MTENETCSETCGCSLSLKQNPLRFLLLVVLIGGLIGLGIWVLGERKTPSATTASDAGAARPAPTAEGQTAKDHVRKIDDATFDKTIAAGVVLVDFYAPWCGPCRAMAPMLESAAADLSGKATVAKVNIDENQRLAKRFNVRSIPLLVVFKDGQEMKRLTGYRPKRAIVGAVEHYVN